MKPGAWIILPTLVILTACGGGGGGIGSSTTTPTPTPAPPTYATLATLTTATTFATAAADDMIVRRNTPAPTDTSVVAAVTMSYNPATKVYSLSATPSGATSATTQTFAPADLRSDGTYAKSYTDLGGSTFFDGLALQQSLESQTGSVAITYNYVGWAQWVNGYINTPAANLPYGLTTYNYYEVAYGIPTLAGDLPRTGTATYPLQLAGTSDSVVYIGGAGTLTVDFAAATVTLSVSPFFRYDNEGQAIAPVDTLTGSGKIDFTTNSFSLSVTGSSNGGTVSGFFYGPQGVEAGGAFSTNPIGNHAGTIAGVFLGKKS